MEVYASRREMTSIRVYEGRVESFTSAAPYGVGIRVISDGRQGFASAGSLDEALLTRTLSEARDNVRFAQPDEHLGLPTPDGLRRPELDLFRPEAASMPAEDKIARLLELERLTLSMDKRIRIGRDLTWSDSVGEQALASTAGVSSWGRGSTCWMSVSTIADENGSSQTGASLTYGRSPSELTPEDAAGEAVQKALRMLGARKPSSAHVTAILEPNIALAFLRVIGRTLSGESVLKGRSPFADRVGEAIAAPILTLVDDPTDPRSMGAWPDDDEGLASRRNVLIEEGTLKGFLYDTYAARRAGTASTGSAVRGYSTTPSVSTRALSLLPGTGTQDDLIASVDSGVLVQSVTGLHSGVSPVSGDFSVGAAGLRIRHGALDEPVQEMTIASTLQRMLQDVVAVGSDLRWFGDSAGVTLAIGDVSLGGT